jgi:hypothetical protein
LCDVVATQVSGRVYGDYNRTQLRKAYLPHQQTLAEAGLRHRDIVEVVMAGLEGGEEAA